MTELVLAGNLRLAGTDTSGHMDAEMTRDVNIGDFDDDDNENLADGKDGDYVPDLAELEDLDGDA